MHKFTTKYVEYLALALELAGATIIIAGAIYAIGFVIFNYGNKDIKSSLYHRFRKKLGEGILLGLEFLVAADIIKSVAIEPTLRGVGVLAIIVLVRTFLSFTLEVEMTGKWPWQNKDEAKSDRSGNQGQ